VRDEVKGRSAPQNRSFANVDEMKKAVGTEVGVSGWLEITQQVRKIIILNCLYL
jgi:hypothetical protein